MGTPGCLALHWPQIDPDESPLSLDVGHSCPGVGHCLTLAVVTCGDLDGAPWQQAAITACFHPLQLSWPSPLSPTHRTCLCCIPAGDGASNTIPEIPGPLVTSLKVCLPKPCCPVPSMESGLPHQLPCDDSHHSGSFSAFTQPATPPARALSSAINAGQLFLDGLLMPRALQQKH